MTGVSAPFLCVTLILLTCSVWTSHEAGFEEQSLKTESGEEAFPGACRACKWIVKKMRKRIPDGAAEDVIREKLGSVCDKAFILKPACRWLVRKYIDKLTAELSTSDDVRTICVHLKACRPKSQPGFI
ncbi:antimicrobial peptide NK-lysin-like [Sardina pilchardus]|uniref:antimicrobial peptide NK-lysin-like n=1 Tax=Sardina pilchardus TaxID=27697 RepID=UPI002E11816C